MFKCKSLLCENVSQPHSDFCYECVDKNTGKADEVAQASSMAELYPQYYKSVRDMEEVDVYAVHQLFNIQDPSGAIQHASKKLLLSGVRTGGKSQYKDIKEAKDTLVRWLELNKDKN
jgi:hypothetical protein